MLHFPASPRTMDIHSDGDFLRNIFFRFLLKIDYSSRSIWRNRLSPKSITSIFGIQSSLLPTIHVTGSVKMNLVLFFIPRFSTTYKCLSRNFRTNISCNFWEFGVQLASTFLDSLPLCTFKKLRKIFCQKIRFPFHRPDRRFQNSNQ